MPTTFKPKSGGTLVKVRATKGASLRDLTISFRNATNPAVSKGFNVSIVGGASPPSGAPQLIGSRAYRYIQINQSLTTDSNSIDPYVQNVTYNFSVPMSWIKQQGISANDIVMFRYSSYGWSGLQTKPEGSNATSYMYSAISPSLSLYAVGFSTTSTTSHTQVTGLDQNSGWMTYFFSFAGEVYNPQSTTPSYSVNDIVIASNDPGVTRINITSIGYNTVSGANIVLQKTKSSATSYNTVVVGVGANVIFTNNGLLAASGPPTTTKNTLSYTVSTANSDVFLLYALSGNNIKTITLPTGGGCTMDKEVGLFAMVGAAAANCITTNTGTFTTAIVANAPTARPAFANTIVAVVFPPYNVVLDDSPGNGNVFTAPCDNCGAFNQANGNVIKVIGDGSVNAVIPSGDTFNGWYVDPANAANFSIDTPTSANTFISIMGDGILTASYNTPVSCTTIVNNQLINFGTVALGQSTATTQNSVNVKNTGSSTANIYVEGTSWQFGASSFGSQNTVWTTNDLGSTGKLTGTFVDTTEQAIAGSSNMVYFGAAVPLGIATQGNYIQTITIEDSC